MGHIVLAAPGTDRCHLVERLSRGLESRGHRATVLCLDAAAFAFWSAQGVAATLVAPGSRWPGRAPLAELADIDCRRRPAAFRRRASVQRRLQRLCPGLQRFFETESPDLVVLHQRRTSAHALVQFIARECGSRVFWTGDGLLPHTMQVDDEGIDGDARASRRSAWDFRSLPIDGPFLAAALAGVVGHSAPPPLTQRPVRELPLWTRLLAAWRSRSCGTGDGFFAALGDWRRAQPAPPLPPRNFALPGRPFLAVLLQPEDDDRLRLDAVSPPSPAVLAMAARAAARTIDADMPVVAVLPAGGLLARQMAPLRRLRGVAIETRDAAIDACVAAAAVVTINDPQAVTALLAGTPVLHLGRALYGVPGVATRVAVDALAASLAAALQDDQPELRQRFLSWMLAHGHVWCSAAQPDHNGLCGLMLQIERRLHRDNAPGHRLRYRPGPAWPLAVEGR